LARGLGHPELAEEFTEALEDEREHLGRVRTWLGAALGKSAGAETARLFEERARERELLLVTSAGLSAERAGLSAMDEEEELPAQAPGKGGRVRAKPARRSAAKPRAGGGTKAGSAAKARTASAKATAGGRAAAKPGRRAPKRAAGKPKTTSSRKRPRAR
jgi:hypothetical protein